MVSLEDIRAHNAQVSSSFPPGLVALFVGATSGIGAATLKAFAKNTRSPRAYFVGRSQEAADQIVAECKTLNPEGEYIFIPADVSLIRVVDEVCAQIKAKETQLNLLCLSQGVASFDRIGMVLHQSFNIVVDRVPETPEGIHLLTALAHYSRARFITQLLPLVQRASSIRRVLTVGAAGLEGAMDTSDFPALRVPFEKIRPHIASLLTLALEAMARKAPGVSFIHDYPGAVNTPLTQRMLGGNAAAAVGVEIPDDWMEPDESGERHLFLLTSGRYPDAELGLGAKGTIRAVQGVDGRAGSGVYSIGWDGECVSSEALEVLKGLREEGFADKVWEHTEGEFARITEIV